MLIALFFWDGAAFLLLGVALGSWAFWWRGRLQQRALAHEERQIREGARREAEAIVREARLQASEEALKIRQQTEQGLTSRREEIVALDRQLREREQLINQQLEALCGRQKELTQREHGFEQRQTSLDQAQADLRDLLQARRQELQRLSHLTEADARSQFLKQIEQESLRDAADLSRHILEAARAKAESDARRILCLALQRYAGDHTFETTTSTVELQGDDIKGRIIGREGRNIRAFEAATGVTVLIDDTPNAVVLSGFDPVRREVAREAMQRLVLDGRIHPTRIEEVVAKVTAEIDEAIVQAGEDSIYQLGLPALHLEIVKLLGRLKFRRSFSQNILAHSVEVAQLCGLMAAELGLDLTAAKRAGLLHDIGKAVNHEIEGAHALIGAELIKRYGEPEEVVNAVASHHDEVPHTNLYGILVSAADAMSAARPGARSETMTTYIKRLEDLERIGGSFPGVERCFAVQAGRELRVVVQPDQLNDEQSYFLARNIARRIEEDLHYPGQIRVTVVRETRCVEFAK